MAWWQVEISFYLLRRLLGVKTQEGGKQVSHTRLLGTGPFFLLFLRGAPWFTFYHVDRPPGGGVERVVRCALRA